MERLLSRTHSTQKGGTRISTEDEDRESPVSSTAREGPLRRKALVGGLWIALQNGYGIAGSAVAFLVLARLISPSKFGLAALAQVVITIVMLVSDLGVTPSLMRVPELSDDTLNTGFWVGLGLSLLLCGSVEAAATTLASWLGQPELAVILRVVALTIPVITLSSAPIVILSRELQMKPQAIRQAVGVTIATVGAIAMAIGGLGVWSLVFQDCGTVLTDAVILWLMISWRPRLSFSVREARTLIGFGYQVTLTQLVNQSQDRVAQLLIGKLLGTTPLGLWVVASQIAQMVQTMFSSTVNAVALPAFSIVQRDRDRLARAIQQSVRICASLAIPGMTALAAAAPLLIPFMFGSRWHMTGTLAGITSLSAAFTAIQFLDGTIWWALGRPRVEFLLVLAITSTHIALVWVFAQYGLVAVALALLAQTLLSGVVRVLALRKLGDVPLSCYAAVPPVIVCSAIMYGVMRALAAALVHSPHLLVLSAELVVGCLAYFVSAIFVQRSNLVELRNDVTSVMKRRL